MVNFMSVLLNFLKPPGKIVTSVLETQFSTCYELCMLGVLLTGGVVDCSCHYTVELIAEVETYSLYLKREDAALTYAILAH